MSQIIVKEKIYRSKKLKSKTPYKGEVIHGMAVEYREDGSISRTSEYVDGKLHGSVTIFHKNGKVSLLYPYRRGIITGIVKEFDSNGNLIKDVFYENDMKNGVEKNYTLTGKIVFETQYLNDVKHGPMINYYPTGEIKRVVNFVNGSIGDSSIEHYTKSGDIDISLKSEIKEIQCDNGDIIYKCYSYGKKSGKDWKLYYKGVPIEGDLYKGGFYCEEFFL